MARPQKEQIERRTRSIGVRLTPAERAVLDADAATRRATPSDLLRSTYFARSNVPMLSPRQQSKMMLLDPSVVASLSRIGANLNQLARRANAGDLLQPGELPDALADLGRVLDRIQALVMAEVDR